MSGPFGFHQSVDKCSTAHALLFHTGKKRNVGEAKCRRRLIANSVCTSFSALKKVLNRS